MKKYMVVFIVILIFLAIGSVTAASADLKSIDSKIDGIDSKINGIDSKINGIGNKEGSQGITYVTDPVKNTNAISPTSTTTSNPQSNVTVTVNATDCRPGEKPLFTIKVTAPDGTPIPGVTIYFKLNEAAFFGKDAVGVDIPSVKTGTNGIAYINDDSHTYYIWPSAQKPGVYPISVTTSAITYNGVDYLNGSANGTANLIGDVSLKVITSPINEGKNASVRVVLTSNNVPLSGQIILLQQGNMGYIIITDANGMGSVSFSELKAGKHLITATFQGSAALAKTTTSIYQQVLPLSDLVITHVKRLNKNFYSITVKNIGSGTSNLSKLKVWYSSKKFKVVNVKALAKNRSTNIKVKFFNFNSHKKFTKYAEINHDKKVEESFYNNNKISFRNNDYQRYKADLIPVSIRKTGNNKYELAIQNNGTATSGSFKISFYYKVKNKIKGHFVYNLKKKIVPGETIGISFSYLKGVSSKYFKYININFDKKVIESNYKNNILKFK